ncbi:MAG: hypothetical protein HY866_12405 [Chloroflexi bacterium]|nr:hypothetical protein [Chloroflexota bacterium]
MLGDPRWKSWSVGSGVVSFADHTLTCAIDPASAQQYSDAQITDYQERAFSWSPPLRLTVRAWASHSTQELKGTAGFGFWNEPFVPGERGLPRLPRAAWFFFGSPPNNMALAKGVPGWGWKAATIDAGRIGFLLLVPLAPLGFLLMRIPALYRWLWPVGQRAIGGSEARLDVDLTQPHDYELEWHTNRVIFRVDGTQVHVSPHSPRGPLGFIAWIDNQYAVVTPQGRFNFGLIATTERQWLALDRLEIQPL